MSRDRDEAMGPVNFLNYREYESGINTDPHADRNMSGGTLNVDYQTPWGTLTSITAFRLTDMDLLVDFDFTGAPLGAFIERAHYDHFSQEIRFASLPQIERYAWLAGVYYFQDDSEHYVHEDGLGAGIDRRTSTQNDTKSIAVFGQLSYRLFAQLEARVGLRYTRERKKLRSRQAGVVLGMPIDFRINSSDWYDAWTPHFTLTYHWSDSVMTYASVSRGFKSGGFNRIPLGPTDAGVDPEFAWNYEVGLKSTWFENRLQLNASLFHMQIEDQQVFFAAVGFVGLRNAARSTSQGVEVELAARPILGLDLSATLGIRMRPLTATASKGPTCAIIICHSLQNMILP